MKIGVVGLWHLGTVTTACLGHAGFNVVAYDNDPSVINKLQNKKLPVFEPGLEEILFNSAINFTGNPFDLKDRDVLWITYDTPVDEEDNADVEYVTTQIKQLFPYLKHETLILISSQLPVGSTKQLYLFAETQYPEKKLRFAYSPENLRLGKAIDSFTHPDRVVIGIEKDADKNQLTQLFRNFSNNLIWMNIESAEMTKHALNAFLATSVVFINELATLCESVGADASEVENGLKSEIRIGQKAYLKPGGAFAGGTLARDVIFLRKIGSNHSLHTPLFNAITESNELHKLWTRRKIQELLNPLPGKTVSLLGLAYKPGTDTLRRSSAIETAHYLSQQGAKLQAYDPLIKNLPQEHQFIRLTSTIRDALDNTDVVIIATECPEFRELTSQDFITLKNPLVVDPGSFLAKNLTHDTRIRYITVGKNG